MERKELGRITGAAFGFGGYQAAMIGLTVAFGGAGWGVSTFHGAWAIERSDYAKWSEEDRVRQLGESCLKLRDLLKDAKVSTVDKLAGIPVECTFDGMVLKDYRILKEVL